jgi:dihydropteroate synthase
MSGRLDHLFNGPKRTWVMAIVNATPDSFSGDGLAPPQPSGTSDWLDQAVSNALAHVASGADLLDIGGESTRPGATPVDAATEIARVVPLIRRIRAVSPVAITIDTSKASVAAAALEAGADAINDVWALAADPDMAALAARTKVPVILMHNSSRPNAVRSDPVIGAQYAADSINDIVARVRADLEARLDVAYGAGIARGRVIIDPGLGFGKTLAQNLELIDRLGELRGLHCPILSGPSRKSFIGAVLDLPVGERVEGTAAAVALSIARGADIVRVHDVAAMARVARMTDAITRR